jgi:uncharacterized membrane protein (DUF441 family)
VFILPVLAALVWGLFGKKRSIVLALVALVVAGLAALGSYYSLVETQSTPWALGYAAAAILAVVVAGRQLISKKIGFC